MKNEGPKLKMIHLAIHIIEKEQNSEQVRKDLASELDDPQSSGVENFLECFNNARTDVKRSIAYASFLEEIDEKYRFDIKTLQEMIEEYEDGEKNDESFLQFSINIAERYIRCLKTASLSTGNHLIVFDYIDESGKPLLALTLLNQEFGSFVHNHKLETSLALNMRQMSLAAIIDINRWKYPGAEKASNYISFICGSKDLSKYYREGFIGCEKVSRSAKATKDFMDAVEGYMKDILNADLSDLEDKRQEAIRFMYEHAQEVNTQELINILLPNPQHQEGLYIYADQNHFLLSSSFKPNKTALKKWEKLVYNKEGVKVEVSKERIEDGTVSYEKAQEGSVGRLVIIDRTGRIKDEYEKFKFNN